MIAPLVKIPGVWQPTPTTLNIVNSPSPRDEQQKIIKQIHGTEGIAQCLWNWGSRCWEQTLGRMWIWRLDGLIDVKIPPTRTGHFHCSAIRNDQENFAYRGMLDWWQIWPQWPQWIPQTAIPCIGGCWWQGWLASVACGMWLCIPGLGMGKGCHFGPFRICWWPVSSVCWPLWE